MNEKQVWTTAGDRFKMIKKPIGFFSSYESRQEISKKSKPSKIAQLNFIKKIRNMRKKMKYLTEAEQSQDELLLLRTKYCSSGDSQTPSSQQHLKRKAPFSNNQDQIFRKLLKVEEDNNENQENDLNENQNQNQFDLQNSQLKAITRYFHQEKQNPDNEPQEDNNT